MTEKVSRRMPRRNPELPQHLLDKLPSDSEMGPAMKALPTKRMQLFVISLTEQNGVINATKAAMDAGYDGEQSGGLKVYAWRLMHDARVIEAVREVAKKRMRFATLQAEGLLVEMMADTSLDPRVRLSAANSVLDRGGLTQIFESKVTHEHTLGREEKLLRYAELLKKSGKDPREAFGNLVDLLPDDMKVISDDEEEET